LKLSKVSVPYNALRDIFSLLVLAVFSSDFSLEAFDVGFLALGSVVFLGIVLVSLVWEYVVWRRYDYYFEEDSLRITHGVFRRDEREIPYRRIQNVSIEKNILQRILGIGKVDFETAGGSSTEASLKYVSVDRAGEVQRKIRELKNGDESGGEDESDRDLVFELSDRDLVAYSFLSLNSRVALGVLAGFGVLSSIGGAVLNRFSIAPVVLFSVLGLVFVSGVWLLNAASNFVQYYGFKLWRERDTLEFERGLLNRSEGSIPVEKVQGVSIEENFLKRQLDYATMKIETAGLSNEQEVKSNEVAVPLAKRGTVLEFGKRLEEFEDFEIKSISSRARRRYVLRYGIGLGIVFLIGLGINSFISFNYWLMFGLVPLILVAAHLKWVNKGYEMQDDYFISVNGFWNRRSSVTPYYRVQNLIQTETVFQRRWSLSTLTLDTAGSLIMNDSRATELDVDEASVLREEVFEKFKKALEARNSV